MIFKLDYNSQQRMACRVWSLSVVGCRTVRRHGAIRSLSACGGGGRGGGGGCGAGSGPPRDRAVWAIHRGADSGHWRGACAGPWHDRPFSPARTPAHTRTRMPACRHARMYGCMRPERLYALAPNHVSCKPIDGALSVSEQEALPEASVGSHQGCGQRTFQYTRLW